MLTLLRSQHFFYRFISVTVVYFLISAMLEYVAISIAFRSAPLAV